MNYSKEDFKSLFQAKFDYAKWFTMLKDFFKADELRTTAEPITDPADCDKGYYIGAINTSDSYRIGLFYYEIGNSNVARKKVGLRNLVKTFINPKWGQFDAALAVFSDGNQWRLSLISDIKGEATAAKRFTFVFGNASNYYNTPIDRFYNLQNSGISFTNIKEAFSVEALTKQFYKDLFEWYQWAADTNTGLTFPNNTSIEEDDRENIDVKIIRMITRVMFVWFIKQKGLVPNSLFEISYLKNILKDFNPFSPSDGAYYNAILQNLFFATLNRAIVDEEGKKRGFAEAVNRKDVKTLYRYKDLFTISEAKVINIFSGVPFLNGGLFECLDKTKTFDGVEKAFYYDGFSRNDVRFSDGRYKNRAFVPNKLFFLEEKGLFSILNRYNFTIEENTPNEQQVALDPELLGKVFENLLGAYNPETKETARNQSGSFYTPREIVQYMVNESLVAHLKRTVEDKLEDKFRQLLDFTTQEVELTDEQKHQIVHALFTCKILDPACGSGAFPMGMLQQMVHVLRQVELDNEQWREVLLDMASDDSRRAFGIADEEERNKKLDEIKNTFNNALNSPDYTRKLYLIESCIYGVDIQPIAMLITRLRFFITLICEQNEIMLDKPEDNFGIKTW